jgi:uncharacterized protein (TIGR02145 family)
MRKPLLFLGLSFLISASEPDAKPEAVAIGAREWMTENLGVTAFRNGDPLKYCWNAEEWIAAIENERPAYTYYDFDPENGVLHGCIYNQYAIRDRRALAPEGWTIPKLKVIKELYKQDPLIAYSLRSRGNQKDGDGLWANKQHAFESRQDQHGFNALPSGELVAFENGMVQFVGMGTVVSWWTGSAGYNAPDRQNAWYLRQHYAGMQLDLDVTSPKYAGHYLRCIKKKGRP